MLREKLNKAIKNGNEMIPSIPDLSKVTLGISPNWAPLVIQQDLRPSGKISCCDRIDTGELIEHKKLYAGRIALDLEVMNFDIISEGGKQSPLKSTGKKFDQIVSSLSACRGIPK